MILSMIQLLIGGGTPAPVAGAPSAASSSENDDFEAAFLAALTQGDEIAEPVAAEATQESQNEPSHGAGDSDGDGSSLEGLAEQPTHTLVSPPEAAISHVLPDTQARAVDQQIAPEPRVGETVSQIAPETRVGETVSQIAAETRVVETVSQFPPDTRTGETVSPIAPDSQARAADSQIATDAHVGVAISQVAPQVAPPSTDLERASRSLRQLDPELRTRVERVVTRMAADYGHEVELVEGYRTPERQAYLFEQGRSRSGPVVTWTRESAHTAGRAADLRVDGGYEDVGAYARLQQVAREEGLVTLGMRDRGHVELPESQLSRSLLVLLQGILCPRACRHRLGQGFFIESVTSPWDVGVVHLIRDPKIMERTEQSFFDTSCEITAVHQVLLAECQEIAPVGSFRRCCKP